MGKLEDFPEIKSKRYCPEENQSKENGHIIPIRITFDEDSDYSHNIGSPTRVKDLVQDFENRRENTRAKSAPPTENIEHDTSPNFVSTKHIDLKIPNILNPSSQSTHNLTQTPGTTHRIPIRVDSSPVSSRPSLLIGNKVKERSYSEDLPGTPPMSPNISQATGRDPLNIIKLILEDVKNLEGDIEKFTGTIKTKEYIFIDEMLTRNLIKLDLIETGGRIDIRQKRKECIEKVNETIGKLESKLEQNLKNITIPESPAIYTDPQPIVIAETSLADVSKTVLATKPIVIAESTFADLSKAVPEASPIVIAEIPQTCI